MNSPDRFSRAKSIFGQHGGMLSTVAAMKHGVHPATLYQMRERGDLKLIARGLYRLASLPDFSQPDLVTVALRARKGVICLISALAFHELTTQIPHEVHLALPACAKPPILRHPPMRIFYYSPAHFEAGVQVHEIDGVKVRIYDPERTLADCFKFQNKIGHDVAIEALKRYCRRKNSDMDALLKFARICRVARVMQPYLEAVMA